MPSWFAEFYHDEERQPELEKIWADMQKVILNRHKLALQLRNSFGGYCDWEKTREFIEYGRGVITNPWRDGGCVPTAPGDLTLTDISDGERSVSWTVPDGDGGAPIDGYTVQWKSGSEDYDSTRQVQVTDLSTLSYTISGLTDTGTTTVRVRAYNILGDGAASEVTGNTAPTGLPTMTVSVSDASATEGAAVAFSVSLSAASSQQVTVDYATSGGTATSGTDFTAASGTLTFAANETSKTVSVSTADDSDDEENETFTLTLSNPANATLGDATATGTITEGGGSPRDRPYDLEATAAGGVITLTWQDPETHESRGYYTILRRRPELGETALAAYAKFVASTNRTFADSVVQAGVLYEYAVRAVTNVFGDLGPASAPVQVRMSESNAGPTLSVSDASATEGDTIGFTVSLSAASSQEVAVEYATSGGTATSGTDFTAASGTLTFGANETSKTVSVSTTDDSDDEENETVTLTLSNPANATLDDASGTGTINDNDDAPTPTVSVSDGSATEGDAVAFTVSLSAASSRQVTVEYATSGGTATSGTDFTAASGTLTFAANETSKTVSVSTADDSVDEENEAFTLTLSNPANATLADSTATGTITDNDEAPTVSVSDASATEGNAVAFTVSLSAATSRQVTVQYATSGGTATSGTDFTAASGTLTFSANETSKTVSVSTTDDSDDEENETFTLTLSNPANATLGDASATGTIRDNDDAPATPLTASFGDMPASHTGGEFTFGLTFSEDVKASFRTLRDDAFTVTGGTVRRARRQQQGSNQGWDITVRPASATDTVKIGLPETTDCTATGAICTHDGRKLSNSVSGTVAPASASSSDADRGDIMEDRDDTAAALDVAAGVSPEEAAAALLGDGELSEARLKALDRLGNRNGRYDLGDVRSWIDRCRRGEARCGATSDGSGPASAALWFGAVALGGGGIPRRRRRRDPGRRGRSPVRDPGRRIRRAGRAHRGRALALLLIAAVSWSCTAEPLGPPVDPVSGDAPVTAAAADPGFLTVEWAGPPAARAIAVLLELEGPGIETVRAPGLELYESSAPGPRRVIVMGSLQPGALVQFRAPDRNRLPLYRVRVLEVTGEDYALRDPAQYRAVITN